MFIFIKPILKYTLTLDNISVQMRKPLGEISFNFQQSKKYQQVNKDNKNSFSIEKNSPKFPSQSCRIQQLRKKYLQDKQNSKTLNQYQEQPKSCTSQFSLHLCDKNQDKCEKKSMIVHHYHTGQSNLQAQKLVGIQQKIQFKDRILKYSGIEWNEQTKSSFFRESFVKNLSKFNFNMENRLGRLEKEVQTMLQGHSIQSSQKMNVLNSVKQQRYQKKVDNHQTKRSPQQNNKLYSFNKNIQQDSKKSLKSYQQQQLNSKQKNHEIGSHLRQSNFKEHLRKVNFVQEMQKRLEAIKKQKQSNISSKLSIMKSRSTSKCQESHKNIDSGKQTLQNSTACKQKRPTLAEFVPNLAQSEVTDVQYNRAQSRVTEKFTISTKKLRDIAQSCLGQPLSGQSNKKIQKSDRLMQKILPTTNIQAIPQQNCQIDEKSLDGDFDQQKQKVPRDFIVLINRIAYFVEAEYKFTQELIRFSNTQTNGKNLKQLLKQRLSIAFKNQGKIFQETIIEVNPLQLDPLAENNISKKQLSQQQLVWLTTKTKNKINKLDQFYSKKLKKSFSREAVSFLVQDLRKSHSLTTKENMNVGNLASYINMRTGKNFRNRSFYKFFRRLNQTKNADIFLSVINVQLLQKGLCKPNICQK